MQRAVSISQYSHQRLLVCSSLWALEGIHFNDPKCRVPRRCQLHKAVTAAEQPQWGEHVSPVLTAGRATTGLPYHKLPLSAVGPEMHAASSQS